MKNRLIGIFLVMVMATGLVQANYIIGARPTICTGSAATAPIRPAAQYSESQCCYASSFFPSSDIVINGIGWYKCTTTTAYTRTIEVRLSEYSAACNMSTSSPYPQGTLVYSGSFSVSAAQGWQFVTFSTPFTRQDGYNLVVDVCDITGATAATTNWAMSANTGYTARIFHYGTTNQCGTWPGSNPGSGTGFAVIQLVTTSGEDCTDPFPIACGECKTGNTSAALNDYDCDASTTGHDGPDVVYEFTLSETRNVHILGEADYDADWGIASECYTNLGDLLCADYFAATSTTNPTLTCGGITAAQWSPLDFSIVLQPGTYYIWVDGYGATDFGNYALQLECSEYTPTITCPGDSIFSQPARAGTDAWEASISDQGYGNVIADDFWGLTEDICDVHWWGVLAYNPGTGWTTCTRPTPDTFDIIFYDDNVGPGTVQASFTVSVTPTVVDSYGGFDLLYYSVDLPSCVSLTEGWISIQAQAAASCWFLWAGSWMGDNIHGEDDGTGWLFYYHDMAFCLTPGEVVTPTPTEIPTETPTEVPTETPTLIPTETPTGVPTNTPTLVPTETPTLIPTETPTLIPTETPTLVPTETPTLIPTETPTLVPTETPTLIPTETPTLEPTETPTSIPTETPTLIPTETPTGVPTNTPTLLPTETPTTAPTETPFGPTATPTDVPPVPVTGPAGLGILMAVLGLLLGFGTYRNKK